ncbi:hypothetical protein GQ602_003955 [Ophiocordyceps camponoti-floridani]|uniref:Uncharacterized protein n=1 Tax=Ophiocordyceps camponoti-floridani TaxID=2030778 RepID=A0A8H4Q5X3_9HYPO|nr:hypothetical protein GQ602_003955 [Ophiocordyceps camponoti-floridani]
MHRGHKLYVLPADLQADEGAPHLLSASLALRKPGEHGADVAVRIAVRGACALKAYSRPYLPSHRLPAER